MKLETTFLDVITEKSHSDVDLKRHSEIAPISRSLYPDYSSWSITCVPSLLRLS